MYGFVGLDNCKVINYTAFCNNDTNFFDKVIDNNRVQLLSKNTYKNCEWIVENDKNIVIRNVWIPSKINFSITGFVKC